MRKKLNLFALTFLLLGQVLLGPMGSMSVYAEGDVDGVEESNATTANEPADSAPVDSAPKDSTPDPAPKDPTPDPAPDPAPKDPTPDPAPKDPTPDPAPKDPTSDPAPEDPTPKDPTPDPAPPVDPVDPPTSQGVMDDMMGGVDLMGGDFGIQSGGNGSVTLFKYHLVNGQTVKLPGAKFELEEQKRTRDCFIWCGSWSGWGNWSKVATDTTDSSGYITINGGRNSVLKSDTSTTQYQYRFKEITPPTGFTWDDSEFSNTFKYNPSNGNELEFKNKLKNNHYWCNGKVEENPCNATVTVYKKDPNMHTYPSNVTITLEKKGNHYKMSDTTNGANPATFTGVHNGSNYLWETVTDGGKFCSLLDGSGAKITLDNSNYKDGEYKFEVTGNNPDQKKYVFTFVNAPPGMNCDGTLIAEDDGSIKITKKFQKTVGGNQYEVGNSNLKATFELLDGDKNSFNPAKIQTTESNGTTTFTDLEHNKTYYVKEVGTSDDAIYALDPDYDGTKNGITITANKKNQEITVKNKKKPHDGKITITKVDDKGKKLNGVGFTLYKDGQPVGDERFTQGTSQGQPKGEVVFANLYYGTYKVKETTVPNDYTVNVDSDGYVDGVTFVINKDNKDRTKKITNYKIPTAQLKVTKTFEDSDDDSLEARFKLMGPDYDEEKTITNREYQTFTNMKPGTYTLTETGTNSSDHGTVDQRTFVVDENGHITETSGITPLHGGQKPPGSSTLLIDIKNPKIPTAELTIHKTFENPYYTNPTDPELLEASFTLKGPGVDDSQTKTVKDGQEIKFENLKSGTYTLIEAAVDNYEPMQPKTFIVKEDGKFEIGDAKTYREEVVNKKKTESLVIWKVDGDHTTEIGGQTSYTLPLSEAKFILLDSAGETWGDAVSVDGIAEFKDVPYGDYRLIEIEAPEGYEINPKYAAEDSTNPQVTDGKPITIESKSSPLAIFLTVENFKTPEPIGSVTLYKYKEGELETGLNGAIFSLYKDGGLHREELMTSSDTAGYLFVDDLGVGKYYFEETSAPTGYTKSPDRFAFEVRLDDSGEGVKVVEEIDGTEYGVERIEVPNTPTNGGGTPGDPGPKGSISLFKYNGADEVINDESGLGGALFDLYKVGSDDPYEKDIETIENTGYTKLIDGLDPGEYYFVETKAPDNFTHDATEKYRFTVADDGKVTVGDTTFTGGAAINVPNTPIDDDGEPTGSVTLYKHRAGELDTGLNGATFSLYKNGELYRSNLATSGDTAGYLFVDDLGVGEYYFVETSPPTGYINNSTRFEFTMKLDEIGGYVYAVDGDENNIERILVPNTPTTTPPPVTPPTTPGGGGGGGGGGGPIILPPTPQPEGPGEPTDPEDPDEPVEIPEEEQPQGPGEPTDPEDPDIPEEIPEEEQPQGPGKPTDPTKPDDKDGIIIPVEPKPLSPTKVTKPAPKSITQVAKKLTPTAIGKVLPRTGEGLAIDLLVTGMIAMLLGGWLLFGRKKKRSSDL